MNGWSELGAIFGGGGNTTRATEAGINDAARLENAILKARQQRDAEIGRHRLHDALVAAGVSDPNANVLSYASAAGYGGLGDYSGYLKGNQLRDIRTQAVTAANGGDLNHENALLAAMHGQPMPLTDVAGDVSFNPNQTPAGQSFTPTEVGVSEIAKNMGLGKAGSSDRFRFTAPDLKPFQRPGATPISAPIIDQDELNAFNTWRVQHLSADPRLSNGEFAYAQWVQLGQPGLAKTPHVAHGAGTAAPYHDGQYLRGADGKLYVVQNGQPVPVNNGR